MVFLYSILGILDILLPVLIGYTEFSKNSPTIDYPCGVIFFVYVTQMNFRFFIILSIVLIYIGFLQIILIRSTRTKIKTSSTIINILLIVLFIVWSVSLWNDGGEKYLSEGIRCSTQATQIAAFAELILLPLAIILIPISGFLSTIAFNKKNK